MSPELLRLKLFIEENIPFKELKKVGFFKKETKKTDYEIIAARFCLFFGFDNIYEYANIMVDVIQVSPTVLSAKFPDTVDNKGELKLGASGIIGIVETEFICPICTCAQDAADNRAYNNAKYPIVTIKCKGCKRKLTLITDIGGNLTVTEYISKK